MISETVLRLLRSFDGSSINSNGEFIANSKSNSYFILKTCENELEIECKVLEWLSRDASISCPFKSKEKNEKLHSTLTEGINRYLGTKLTPEELEIVYTRLGNQIDRKTTIQFIECGCDMRILGVE